MPTKTYQSHELSNERYHSEEFPQASGSILHEIYTTCPAQYRYGEKKESKSQEFGTAAHCIVLENSEFANRFVRGVNPDEHSDLLITNADMQAWLKSRGIAKYSGKDKAELMEMINATGENPPVLAKLEQQLIEQAGERKVLKHSDFDKIQLMRSTLIANGYDYVINDGTGYSEFSIVDDELNLKCRIDRLLTRGNGEVWDYKTTNDVHPEAFGNQAARLGYYLKMAIQADLFEYAYGHLPDRVVLLAQCTKSPFIPVAYELDADQLNAGRQIYQGAKLMYEESLRANRWQSYAAKGEVVPLPTPRWAAYEYGIQSDLVEFLE